MNSKNNGIKKKKKKTIWKVNSKTGDSYAIGLRYDTVWFIYIDINFSLISLGKQLVHAHFFWGEGGRRNKEGCNYYSINRHRFQQVLME